jgi:hypothetical protein
MSRKIKWALITIVALIICLSGLFKFLQYQTKKSSPEETIEYNKKDKKISVSYCRPYVKNRVIFDSLVPYGKVWRTGANEPTTFTTATEIKIGDKTLGSGTYTLWTIPNKDSWNVILNSKKYGWGVTFDGVASREPQFDVLSIQVPTEKLQQLVEQFTISFEDSSELKMILSWEKTRVAVPIN